jgi:hypothetical protein
VVHCVATAKEPTKFAAATLTPTDLTFINLPFVENNGDKGRSGLEDGENNMLVYLQMVLAPGETTVRNFPREPLSLSVRLLYLRLY